MTHSECFCVNMLGDCNITAEGLSLIVYIIICVQKFV